MTSSIPKSSRRLGLLLIGARLALLPATAGAADPPAPLLSASPSGAELMLKTLEDRLGGNPFDPVAMNNLAIVKLGENNPYAAAELLGRAYQLAADNPVIADNHARLNAWIEARAKASRKKGEPVEDPGLPFPPEPPALWRSR
ncbi:MAG: hypothetical protein C0434_13785 [Xanthomonadaceae bacterium]|nr:hypothetical protein [Xanthomonadaceae bacterium]